MVHTHNSSTHEGEFPVWEQPGIYSEILFFLLKYSLTPLFICAFSQDLRDFVSSKTKQTKTGVDKMSQKVKTLMTKPDDLSSIPGRHMIEEGNQ